MRKKGDWSEATYTERATEVKKLGTATFEGEQRVRQGKALDPLVDPGKYGGIKGSGNLLVQDGDEFILPFGVAMPVETDLDTTGSMGDNVNIGFRVLPKVQNLLVQGKNAVLRRYHTQIATGIIQDRVDRYPYLRSMFEPDNEVERQMGLLVPEKSGGDATEDYQLGLFAAAYLTNASITKYGLRGYYFPTGDQIGRDSLDQRVLEQVFGSDVLKNAFGSKLSASLPSTRDVAKVVLKNWHGFFLQVNNTYGVSDWWRELFGSERVIRLPQTEDLAEVQACIIGLTEGVLDIKTALDFLVESNVTVGRAKLIVEAVANIPIGLQTTYPNFNKIPPAGSRFKSREDIWPIDALTKVSKSKTPAKTEEPAVKKGGKKKNDDWKL